MPLGGRLASTFARASMQADAMRQQEEEQRQQQQDAELRRLAMMQAAGLTFNAPAETSNVPQDMQTTPIKGGPSMGAIRVQPVANPDAYIGDVGGRRLYHSPDYFAKQAAAVAAARQKAADADAERRYKAALTLKAEADARKAGQPATPPVHNIDPLSAAGIAAAAERARRIQAATVGGGELPRDRRAFVRQRLVYYMRDRRVEVTPGFFRSEPGLPRDEARRQAELDADAAYNDAHDPAPPALPIGTTVKDGKFISPYANRHTTGAPDAEVGPPATPYANVDEARADYDAAAASLKAAGRDPEQVLGKRP